MSRSREFLGFLGKDCEAVIDLGKSEEVSKVVVYTLSQGGSWVYPAKNVVVSYSNDGVNFTKPEQKFISRYDEARQLIVELDGAPIHTRYIKVLVENFGIIPTGMSGAGHGAWLFVDEVQVF